MSRGLAFSLLTALGTGVFGALSILIVNVVAINTQLHEIAGALPHIISRLDRHEQRLDRLEQRGNRYAE